MGFLSGRITFEWFRIGGSQPRQFGPEHIEILKRFAIGQVETSSTEQPDVGFLAGEHLFDSDFDLEKNVIGDALHCAVRIDTNQIPAAVRKAWLQMELAALAADNPSGRPTKVQRQEAKEAVEARCEDEARAASSAGCSSSRCCGTPGRACLYFGGTSPTASEHCGDLFAGRSIWSWGGSPRAGAPRSGPPRRNAARRWTRSSPSAVPRRQPFGRDRLVEQRGGQLRFPRQRVPALALVALGDAVRHDCAAGRFRSDRHARPNAQPAVPAGRVGQGDDHGRGPGPSAGSGAGDPLGQAPPQSRPDPGPARRAVRTGAPGGDVPDQRGEDPDRGRARKGEESWRTGSRAFAGSTRRWICSSGPSASGGSARIGPANWSRCAAG